ncbi:MAG: hypothetical protein B6I20_10385 [Bacteroidetes bacterium 4572_117]|nr:MAG: hypothetical protein B6I20_10385 [Bacteroidetes bacterium 4572_117]
MITSLKNNARPKRRLSDLLKENEKKLSGRSGKLKFKEVSDSELKKIKEKIRRTAITRIL